MLLIEEKYNMKKENEVCEHLEILFNKEYDFNYCAKCKEVIYEDIVLLNKEEEMFVDNYDIKLRELNEL